MPTYDDVKDVTGWCIVGTMITFIAAMVLFRGMIDWNVFSVVGCIFGIPIASTLIGHAYSTILWMKKRENITSRAANDVFVATSNLESLRARVATAKATIVS